MVSIELAIRAVEPTRETSSAGTESRRSLRPLELGSTHLFVAASRCGEWGRQSLPELAIEAGGTLEPLVEYLLCKARHGLTAGSHAATFDWFQDLMGDLERVCDREAAPRIPAPANEATVTLGLAFESVAASRAV